MIIVFDKVSNKALLMGLTKTNLKLLET